MHLHTCLPYCMFCISPQCWLYPDLKSIMHYADDTFKFGFDMVWVLYVCLFKHSTVAQTLSAFVRTTTTYNNLVVFWVVCCDCWKFICFECM